MELTIAQKLDALLKLQQIDSKLDELVKVRGDLPEEVQDLEDEIAGFETRVSKFQKDIDALDTEISGFKQAKKDSEKLIAKYKEQQNNVRNNREFDAISKEIEFQHLEQELADKKISETTVKIKFKNEEVGGTKSVLNERKEDLKSKKAELDVIIAESQDEEKALAVTRQEQSTHIEERLLRSYMRIRQNSVNGLAVVAVKRGACGGCFNMVPPQRQADIREKKKLIVCEHCGRIFADVDSHDDIITVRRI